MTIESAVVGRRIFEGAKKLTRTALVGLGAMILLAPVAAGQPPVKAARIGVLSGGAASTQAVRNEAFRQGLSELGYVEGRNIVIEYRYAEGKTERLPALAAELVRLKVDLILISGDHGVRAAKQASHTIPIVVAVAGDLVGPGHVASLARPGGNITGQTAFVSELSAKRLELLKTAFPKVSRVAIIWNPTNADNVAGFKAAEVAARALRIQLLPLDVRRPDDFEGAFPAALRARADAPARSCSSRFSTARSSSRRCLAGRGSGCSSRRPWTRGTPRSSRPSSSASPPCTSASTSSSTSSTRT